MSRNKQQGSFEKFRKGQLYCTITSTLAGFGVLVACMLLFSLLITKLDVPDVLVTVLSCVSLCIGAYSAGVFCSKRRRKNGLLLGISCGAVMFFVVLLLSIIFAKTVISMHFTAKLLLTLFFGAFGGVIGVNSRRKRY